MWTVLSNGWADTVLITTYEPDQGLWTTIDLVPGSCYMTSV
jgi:hypothetical protein